MYRRMKQYHAPTTYKINYSQNGLRLKHETKNCEASRKKHSEKLVTLILEVTLLKFDPKSTGNKSKNRQMDCTKL
jgi:hypothetical protein